MSRPMSELRLRWAVDSSRWDPSPQEWELLLRLVPEARSLQLPSSHLVRRSDNCDSLFAAAPRGPLRPPYRLASRPTGRTTPQELGNTFRRRTASAPSSASCSSALPATAHWACRSLTPASSARREGSRSWRAHRWGPPASRHKPSTYAHRLTTSCALLRARMTPIHWTVPRRRQPRTPAPRRQTGTSTSPTKAAPQPLLPSLPARRLPCLPPTFPASLSLSSRASPRPRRQLRRPRVRAAVHLRRRRCSAAAGPHPGRAAAAHGGVPRALQAAVQRAGAGVDPAQRF